ncbi:MAG: xanthine dehydrogenase family protein molybdopterin-binding subunit [Edaphobacter sp.]|uniref:xanthine dehydrogenase family protein molybdopterin-binding subunit n=1 Tax=Edaphobacter sp. TaxID=1934404 RepID=UPI002391F033|nr:xanthine dehydrogenase family protein molybdopterin-binding subunit [Edaphobacter sp.]MDE1177956.1 xanthine dehydrogenase family protein molybdopterin-binding subunit [Edaphobacter sp.]
MSQRVVGVSVPRKEGAPKVTGTARYIDDLSFEGMMYGATVRSTIARGRIAKIEFGEGVPWNEFVVVTAEDVPGKNVVSLITDDQPILAETQINHPEEPILLLAHEDRHLLPLAVAAVKIEYEAQPSIHSMEDSESCAEVIWGTNNIFKTYTIDKGAVDEVWKDAAWIVEGEYTTGAQEQLYIENNGVIAQWSEDEGATVWGSMQCPFYVHKALMALTGLPAEKVRVLQVETGGAFGGKEDYPSIIAGHALLLAKKAGRPVKIVYDRMEDMAATTKRHPSRTRHRTAVDKDGKLLGAEIEFVIDGGAYSTLSPVVLSRGTIHAGGPYYWPNIRVKSKAVATNTPPHGAFRGFGAPQSLFALERHMDFVARTIGLAPDEFRRRNLLKPGQTTATAQEIREPIDMPHLLDRALELSGYHAKMARFAKTNATSSKKKGMGIAAFLHGAGFTGSGERYLNALVGVEANERGEVRVLVSSTEFGQGTNTILTQIAAETLGLEYEDVSMAPIDTRVVPNSGPTVASRTAMIIGKLVQTAAFDMQKKLVDAGLMHEGDGRDAFRAACNEYTRTMGALNGCGRYEAPPNVFWDDSKYMGEAYPAFGWAVYVAEVTVDTATYSVTVDDFVALQEIGRVLHPVLAAGQIEGGVAQGIGYALYEKVVWNRGRMMNNQMTNYIMPTSEDLPPIRVFFEEIPYAYGPYGAKGIGELPMDGPAPAIINAVVAATGEEFRSIPLLPEDVFDVLSRSHEIDEVTA